MSGGSMDYFYLKVEDAADRFRLNTAERKALRILLLKLTKALRAIEWNDSGDGDPNEKEAILACLTPEAPLAAVLVEAEAARADLSEQIEIAKKVKP